MQQYNFQMIKHSQRYELMANIIKFQLLVAAGKVQFSGNSSAINALIKTQIQCWDADRDKAKIDNRHSNVWITSTFRR